MKSLPRLLLVLLGAALLVIALGACTTTKEARDELAPLIKVDDAPTFVLVGPDGWVDLQVLHEQWGDKAEGERSAPTNPETAAQVDANVNASEGDDVESTAAAVKSDTDPALPSPGG